MTKVTDKSELQGIHSGSFTALQHTLNHKDCPACAVMLTMDMRILPETGFLAASEIWLSEHSRYIKPGTYRVYRQYVSKLQEFLEDIVLCDINIGTIRSYQRSRQACATRINAEVSALQQILKQANLWKRLKDVYRPLPVPPTKIRQNMSEEQERRLIAVALDASKPRRLLAGHCLIVMANTSMGFGELRHLRREDVFLAEAQPYITINGGTKNDYRIRTVPLNWLALRSMRWIVKRWEDLGGTEPDQYILPHHARRTPEQKASKGHKRQAAPLFYEPMGHIYRAARGILKEAGMPNLNPYDMRSHFITKLLSDPNTSEQVYEEIVGHVSKKMRMRYSKQRLEKKAVAVARVCLEQEPPVRLIAFPGGRK